MSSRGSDSALDIRCLPGSSAELQKLIKSLEDLASTSTSAAGATQTIKTEPHVAHMLLRLVVVKLNYFFKSIFLPGEEIKTLQASVVEKLHRVRGQLHVPFQLGHSSVTQPAEPAGAAAAPAPEPLRSQGTPSGVLADARERADRLRGDAGAALQCCIDMVAAAEAASSAAGEVASLKTLKLAAAEMRRVERSVLAALVAERDVSATLEGALELAQARAADCPALEAATALARSEAAEARGAAKAAMDAAAADRLRCQELMLCAQAVDARSRQLGEQQKELEAQQMQLSDLVAAAAAAAGKAQIDEIAALRRRLREAGLE